MASFYTKEDGERHLEKPEKIAINHDNYSAKHIGRTKDGLQFFLTTPFEPAFPNTKGCEYIALFKFDLDGNLVDAKIDTIGPRGSYNEEERRQKYLSHLYELGEVKYQRIEVKPFSIKHNNVDIGLIIREPVDDDDIFAVELLPGNYMAFFEPWDSGEYDT